MFDGKTFLAIIPARGGSKRLPRKNILELSGRPLIAWTVEAAVKCPHLDEVMVTTDDKEIAEVAKKYGANVPFVRPGELASDTAASFDVAKHAIDFYQERRGKAFDYTVLLQPTSPLRKARHIMEAIELMLEKKADAVISVCEVDHPPLWANTLPEDRSMANFLKEEVKGKRSQDFAAYYRLNGAIYICKTSRLIKEKTFFPGDSIYAYEMPIEDSIDIDTEIDLLVARSILQKNQHGNEING